MLKSKRILLIILILMLLIIIPTIVNAEETFTTTDGIVVKKIVTGFSNGSIELDISNIELSSEGNYVWGIGSSASVDNITKWYVLGDINSAKSTTKINLTVQDRDILSLLRKTDTAYLYIKNNADDSLIVDALQLDLTLPPLYAFNYTTWLDSYYIIGGNLSSVNQWDGTTYNIVNAYYKFERIADETLISKYKQAIINGTSLSNVFSIDKNTVMNIENWNACTRDHSYPFTKIDKSEIPTERGTYYLWLKAKDTDSKTVYGCLIIDIDGDGPKVESIRVTSPNSGTYTTGQTVKIRVEFSEAITGTTVPTLKIKFGDSAVRSISNGTIVNTEYSSNYIEYLYNIQASDKGQLATVELSGGNIKDTSGNEAILSCPVITGNTIKANVERTTTNNTENKDKTNNNNNNSDEKTNNTSQKDTTTAKTVLPYTGKIILIWSIAIVAVSAIVAHIRYKKLYIK